MRDEDKTKEQLIQELIELRKQLAEVSGQVPKIEEVRMEDKQSVVSATYGAEEPWLPIETKLVVRSVIAGVILLIVLMAEHRRWYNGMLGTEDWWAVWIGLFFVLLGLIAAATGVDSTGWIIKFSKWVDITKSFRASHKGLVSPATSLFLSYIIFTFATCLGAKFMRWNVKKYFVAWSIIFWLTVLFYIVGQNAYIAATSLERGKYGIEWSLSLGGAYYIIALFAGLFIGNLTPKRFRTFMKEAAKPEWFIKVAIVCLGTKLGLKAIEATGFAMHLLFAGCCATIAAYMLFWPLAYAVSRKIFKLSKEWAACLASAISICGVSAAIATGGAIKARPIVPIMISSLVVVYWFLVT
jgi:hypothetical protein